MAQFSHTSVNAKRFVSSLVRRAVTPLVPPRKRLAVLSWSFRRLEGHDPELEHLDRIVPPGCRTAVDAGANMGMYSLRLAGLARSVYSFEINPRVTDHLEHAGLPNVRLVHTGLSDSARRVTLYIPILDGWLPLHGWASLSRGNCPDTDEETEVPGEVRTLDSFGLTDVDFMKIDVEGHELQVLHGARDTLAQCRPRILAEVRRMPPVASFLSQFGYRATRAEEFGVEGSAPWMHVFDAR